MFTQFTPRHDMLAHELMHQVMAPLPLHIARLVTSELGTESFRRNGDSAWYGVAHITAPQSGREADLPFALRINRNGQATLTVSHGDEELMSHAIATLVPDIYAEPMDYSPRGHRSHSRAA